MKKLVAIIIIVFTVLTAVITCPDRGMHKQAINASLKSVINKEIDKSSEKDNDVFVSSMLSMIGSSLTSFVIDNYLIVDNYFVFSIGKIVNNEEKVISLGAFNHVFTFSKEDLEEAMESSNQTKQ